MVQLHLCRLFAMFAVILAAPHVLFAQVTYEVVADLASIGGVMPLGGVIPGADGALYGTTSQGGSENCGLVYRLDATGALGVVHDFSAPDGCRPMGELTLGPDGALYGTASQGGLSNDTWPSGSGTIYRIAVDGAFSVLYRFPVPSDSDFLAPFWPRAGLTLGLDGFFYGTLYSGDVYRIAPDGTFNFVRQISAPGPQFLSTAPAVGADGFLYGTSPSGDMAGTRADRGSLYRVSLGGDPEELRHFFFLTAPDGTPFSPEGGLPMGEVVVGPAGEVFGTNTSYGPNAATDRGTIFRWMPDGTFAVIHAFSEAVDHSYPNGATPVGGLSVGSDGQVYGRTSAGGASGNGTLFRISTDGVFETLLSFPMDGYRQAKGRVFEASPGVFYGTAISDTGGVVYRVGPPSPPTTVRLKLIFPHPNAKLEIGSTETIRWIHNLGDGALVRLELSRDGGVTWELLAPAVESDRRRGSFEWSVTGPATDEAIVRVTSVSTDAFDISNKSFRIRTRTRHTHR